MTRQLSPQGRQAIDELAQRYGVSAEAVTTLLNALIQGNGSMAQFNHPDLGGSGQWIRGGMTMVGDMFDHALKAKVDGLCSELARLLDLEPQSFQRQQQSQQGGGKGSLFTAAGSGGDGRWWPAELGTPTTSGSQNGMRYAYFAEQRRLAVEVGGQVTVYDTLDHRIGGVSQQQSGGASLSFASQHGPVDLASLPVVSGAPAAGAPAASRATAPSASAEADVFAQIERLAELKQKGILSEEEYAAKKAELLRRI